MAISCRLQQWNVLRFPDWNQIRVFSTDFHRSLQYQISRKSFLRHADRRTGNMRATGTVRGFANSPSKQEVRPGNTFICLHNTVSAKMNCVSNTQWEFHLWIQEVLERFRIQTARVFVVFRAVNRWQNHTNSTLCWMVRISRTWRYVTGTPS
jgi:hypothetical protein